MIKMDSAASVSETVETLRFLRYVSFEKTSSKIQDLFFFFSYGTSLAARVKLATSNMYNIVLKFRGM